MRFSVSPVVLLLCSLAATAASLSLAAPTVTLEGKGKRSYYNRDGVKRTLFQHRATNSSIDFVTNSGICETTPGVNQYSGYLSIGNKQSMFFWFFESRSDPQHAPLATWFNGGPGCSSMLGLFQENGPCRFEEDATEPSLNPNSWNEYANMLYIDQPFGVGFSNEFGTPEEYDGTTSCNSTSGDCTYKGPVDPLAVNSTVSAAVNVWKLLQAFYDQFPQYENRDFGIFTESYGGHYGPEFASYFESQNAAIASGSVAGQNISLVALGINNGWFDSKIQEKAYIDFSLKNNYTQLINQTQYDTILEDYNKYCLPDLANCTDTNEDWHDCEQADNSCYNAVDDPIYNGDVSFNVYDLRENATQPSSQYSDYLSRDDVMSAIGAKDFYTECNNQVSDNFYATGDHVRSFIPALSTVVKSGVTTLIWAGDADWICNWMGNLAVVDALDFPKAQEFNDMTVANYTVNGTVKGTFKTLDNLSWLRVFEAGHEIPFYQPEVGLQVFKQTMQKQAIFSTKAGGEAAPNPNNGTSTGKKGGSGLSAKPELLAVFVCMGFAMLGLS